MARTHPVNVRKHLVGTRRPTGRFRCARHIPRRLLVRQTQERRTRTVGHHAPIEDVPKLMLKDNDASPRRQHHILVDGIEAAVKAVAPTRNRRVVEAKNRDRPRRQWHENVGYGGTKLAVGGVARRKGDRRACRSGSGCCEKRAETGRERLTHAVA